MRKPHLIFQWIRVSMLILTASQSSCGVINAPDPRRNEKLSRTHYLLGADYFQKHMPLAAKQELLTALKLDPANRDAHFLSGVICFYEGVHKLNLMDIDQCLQGRAAEEQRVVANEDFRAAEQHLLRFINLSEQEQKIESSGLVYLANIATHFGRFDEAIRYCKKALTNVVYGSRHLAMAAMGWAYLKKGNFIEAERELRQAIFYSPQFCVGRYRLAKVFYEEREYDQAIEELGKIAVEKECPIQEVTHLLGLSYMKKGEHELAQTQFDRCVKQNTKSCLSRQCQRLAKDISS